MRVRELMALNLFKKSKLLTGSIGLENEIDSAMVLEAIDIENWSRKNQLILTSFYAFKDVPEVEWISFFEKTKTIGISGLVIKMDRLITIIPDRLIELCFQYEIPLIKVTTDVTYEKIILTIYEPLLYNQGHLLRTYYDARQRFTEIERNLQSYDQILSVVHQLTESPCSFSIAERDYFLHYGKKYENYVVTSREILDTNEFTKNRYERLSLLSPDHSQEVIAYQTTLFIRTHDYCTLTLFEQFQTIREAHIMVLENAIDVIHEYAQMQYQLKKDRRMRLNHLADAILQNTPSNMDELNSLLDDAQMNQFPYYQGIAFTCKQEYQLPLQRTVRKKISRLRKNVLFFEHYNYTMILYNLETPDDEVTKREIEQLFSEESPLAKETSISLSQIKEKNQLKRILSECLNVLRFNHHFYIGSILSYKDLGIFQYFLEEERMDEIEAIIPRELVLLQQKNYDAFETLFTFFQCGRNYKKTADCLFLHPKTIHYRMDQIEQQFHIDLKNPIQLANCEIAVYLLKAKTASQF